MINAQQTQTQKDYSWIFTAAAFLTGGYFLGPSSIMTIVGICVVAAVLDRTLYFAFNQNKESSFLAEAALCLSLLWAAHFLTLPILYAVAPIFIASMAFQGGAFPKNDRNSRARASDKVLRKIIKLPSNFFTTISGKHMPPYLENASYQCMAGLMAGVVATEMKLTFLLPLSAAPIAGTVLALILIDTLHKDSKISNALAISSQMGGHMSEAYVEMKSRITRMLFRNAPSSVNTEDQSSKKNVTSQKNPKGT